MDCGLDVVYADGGDSFTRALIQGNFFTYISEAGIRISANLVTPASTIAKDTPTIYSHDAKANRFIKIKITEDNVAATVVTLSLTVR